MIRLQFTDSRTAKTCVTWISSLNLALFALPEPVPRDAGDGLEADRGAEGRHREDGRLHRRHPPHVLQRPGVHRPHGRPKTEG